MSRGHEIIASGIGMAICALLALMLGWYLATGLCLLTAVIFLYVGFSQRNIPARKDRTLCLVVADNIVETNRISPLFLARSEAPIDFFHHISFWGVITLKPKDPDFLDLFSIERPGVSVQEVEQIYRWELNVFKTGERPGPHLAGGFDQNPNEESLSEILSDPECFTDCVLLTHKEALESLRKTCDKLHIKLLIHKFEGPLPTS